MVRRLLGDRNIAFLRGGVRVRVRVRVRALRRRRLRRTSRLRDEELLPRVLQPLLDRALVLFQTRDQALAQYLFASRVHVHVVRLHPMVGAELRDALPVERREAHLPSAGDFPHRLQRRSVLVPLPLEIQVFAVTAHVLEHLPVVDRGFVLFLDEEVVVGPVRLVFLRRVRRRRDHHAEPLRELRRELIHEPALPHPGRTAQHDQLRAHRRLVVVPEEHRRQRAVPSDANAILRTNDVQNLVVQ